MRAVSARTPRVQRPALLQARFRRRARQPRLFVALCGWVDGRRSAPPGPAAERALAHPHQDVLDEGAHERRVIPDPCDAESGRGDGAFQVRHVGQRIQVVGLPEVFLRQVDEAESRERVRAPVDRTDAERNRRILPHVRIDEHKPAGTDDPRDFGEHRLEALA